jgi:hypothetical protein
MKDGMTLLRDIYEAGSELFLTGFRRKVDADAKAKESSTGFVKDVYTYEFQDGTYVVSSAKGKEGKIVSAYRDGKRFQMKGSVAGFDYLGATSDRRGFVGTSPTASGFGSSSYAPYGKTTIESKSFITESQLSDDLRKEGLNIANRLGVLFNGWWEDLKEFAFTDKQTESTFAAKTYEDAKRKLERMRQAFADARSRKLAMA